MRIISAKRFIALLAAAGVLAAGLAEAAPAGDRSKKRKARTARSIKAPRAHRAFFGSDVYYPNCTAARAAGAAPIRRGAPGYSGKLDRDGDGIACE